MSMTQNLKGVDESPLSDINRNKDESATVYRTFEDGYVVRAMTPSDTDIVVKWYSDFVSVSSHDLATALAVFPPGPGFYIGELDGEVVASAIGIPWSDRVYYGAFYYVAKAHRRRGYGTRLRHQVVREHVGDHIVAIDSVLGKVADDNVNKFDFVPASYLTRRAQVVVRDDVTADAAAYRGGSIVPVDQVSFDRLIAYDDLCFIGSGNPVRAEFLRLWVAAAGGASYVAMAAKDGRLTGYGCRRPCVDDQRRTHVVGPLYADNSSVAEALLRRLCADVVGETVVLDFWLKNQAALTMTEKFGFEKVFDLARMHLHGDANEYKESVFAVTSLFGCGF